MRAKALLLILLILLTSLFVPVAHASGPTEVQSVASGSGGGNCSSGTSSCTTGQFGLLNTIGDVIILTVGIVVDLAHDDTTNGISTVTDAAGNSYNQIANTKANVAYGSGGASWNYVYCSVVTANTNGNFATITTQTTNTATIGVVATEFSGVPNCSTVISATGTNPNSMSMSTSSLGWDSSGSYLWIVSFSPLGVVSGGVTGFTTATLPTYDNANTQQFDVSAPLPNPNTFSASTSTSNGWTEIAVGIQVTAPVTVVTVAPCTFSELQCWWYPLFFMGLYSGFVLMVGTWLRTSPRGKSHLFLSAVTFGSLVAVIFGIMNIAFPLMMLVLNTIIALRLRG